MTDEKLPEFVEPVIITDNVTLQSITANGITVDWPTTAGTATQALLNDGLGHLYWGEGGGGDNGNVSTEQPFTSTNYVTVTDTVSSPTNIKQSLISIDTAGNVSNANILTSNYITANNDITVSSANKLRLSDATNTYAVSLLAPNALSNNYQLAMPAGAPTTLQSLRTSLASVSQYEWFSPYNSQSPAISRCIYVANGGSDINGTGSLDQPFASIARAITIANTLALASNPVVIQVQPGVYIENNTIGALTITATGVTICGLQSTAVIIQPLVRSNVLFSFIVSTQLSNLTISSGGVSTAAAINITGTGNSSSFNTIQIVGFYTGIYCSTSTSQSLFRNLLIRSCNTSIYVNNCIVIAISLIIQGSTTSTPANTGIYTTGAIGKLLVSGGAISNCIVALSFANDSLGGISSLSSVANVNDLTVSSGSTVFVSAVQYTDGTTLNDVTISVSGASTVVELCSCNIDGYDYVHGTVSGTGISCTLGATVLINSSIIQRYTNGVVVGINTDVSNTKMTVSDVFFTNNTVDIAQLGTSSLSVSSSTMSLSKLAITSPDNVSLSFSDETTGTMSIGSTAATPIILSKPLQSLTNNPTFGFTPSMYNTSSFIEQSTNGLMHSVVSSALSGYAAVTQNRAMPSVIRLASDTYTPTGTTNALRYWDISKNNSTHASLDFTFGNTDTNGLAAVTPFVFAEFDAVDLSMTLAPSAKIVLQDTISSCDLYVSNMLLRSSTGLSVNGNITASGLNSGYALYTGANGLITSSGSSAIELGYLTGVTSSIQTQLNSKFSTSGGTLTNSLVLPMGSVSSMPLGFTGSTAGIYAATNILSIGIGGSTVASFTSSGLTLQLASGVLHSSSGLITSSLIVGTDIATNANISNSSLATLTASGLVANSATSATSANTPGSIVTRDATGGFSVGTITLLNIATNSTDAVTKAYVDSAVGTGFTPRTPANVLANSNVTLSGLPIIDSYQLVAGSRVLLISQLNQVQNGLYVAAAGAWSRPSDFATGSIAGSAYVLITNGAIYTGSSYICNTPNAIVDTNNILFVEFSLPVTVSGANIGSGTGLVYYGTSDDVLSFKTLATGANCTIINGLTDITIGVNSTNLNTPYAIVSRDISGDFSAGTITANLTGVASGCLALTGGTLTGQLALISGTSSSPALSFSSALTSGLFYSLGVCVSVSGSTVSTFSSNGLSINIAGTSTVPSLSIVGNVGFSAYQLNTLSAIINNSDVASFAPSGLVVREGSVLNPSITFYGNLDTGFSHSNGIAVSVDSALVAKFTSSNLQLPLSTSGILYTDSSGNVNSTTTIANSYTTATSVNTANTIVSRNGSGDFSAGTITASLTGVASGCLALTGGTLTGQLVVPVGTSGSNSIVFGSSLTGIYSVTSGLALVTNSTQKIYIDSTGYIQLLSYGVGILHSDASGIISSSLIIGADIATNANIQNSSLATLTASNLVANSATTATSLNTSSAIVSRDTLGNFAAGTITANLIGNVTGSASGCLPLTGGILSGQLILPAGSSTSPSLTFTSSTTSGFSCEVANIISVNISSTSVVRFSSNGLTINSMNVAGVVVNGSNGLLSSIAVLPNANTTATNINTANAIVSRDSLGGFSAGTIVANLTGVASGCLPLTGGTLSGQLILPAGSSTSPSLTFTSSTTSGFSCEVANIISVDISSTSVVRFSSNGLTLPLLLTNHILYTNATGIISAVTIGAGLSFSSGILTSTGGGTTYTPGTGVNISSNVISIGQDVATTSSVIFAGLKLGSLAGLLKATTGTIGVAASTDYVASLTGTANRVTVSASTGAITLNLPQDIATTSSPQFAGLKLGSLAGLLKATSGMIGQAVSSDYVASITGTTNQIIASASTGAITLSLSTSPTFARVGSSTVGSQNVFIGDSSGGSITTGSYNVAIGQQALQSSISGQGNVAVGYIALNQCTNANNTAVGGTSGYSLTTGSNNVFIGNSAGRGANALTTGINCCYIGTGSSPSAINANREIVIGDSIVGKGDNTAIIRADLGLYVSNLTGGILASTSVGKIQRSVGTDFISNTGTNNVLLGSNAGITTGSANVIIGLNSGASITTGSQNIAIGQYIFSGGNAMTNTNGNNVAVGNNAFTVLANTSGYNIGIGSSGQNISTANNNIVIGNTAGNSIRTSSNNIAIGNYSIGFNTTIPTFLTTTDGKNVCLGNYSGYTMGTTASANTCIGNNAMYSGTNPINNTCVGQNAGYYLTTGSNNTGIGGTSLGSTTTGNNNVAVGYSTSAGLTTGSYNIHLGVNTQASSNTVSNEIVIGSQSTTTTGRGTNTAFINAPSGLFSFSPAFCQLRSTAFDNGIVTWEFWTAGPTTFNNGFQLLLSNTLVVQPYNGLYEITVSGNAQAQASLFVAIDLYTNNVLGFRNIAYQSSSGINTYIVNVSGTQLSRPSTGTGTNTGWSVNCNGGKLHSLDFPLFMTIKFISL